MYMDGAAFVGRKETSSARALHFDIILQHTSITEIQ
jgi:hypothetical protein